MPKSRSAPRLADVAARAGVSIATASRSLAGRDGVSEAVAAHVREVARQLGYVANVHARTLAGGSTSTVGLIVHEIGDPYFTEIASGVIGVAAKRGFTVQICHSGRDPVSELHQIRTLIAHRTDAIIIAGSGYTDPALQAESNHVLLAFQESGGRVAVIGRHFLTADAVRPDNEAAGRAIAAHLLELGHRRIGVLAGPPILTTVADRLAGVDAALQPYGLALSEGPLAGPSISTEGPLAGPSISTEGPLAGPSISTALPVVHTDFTRAGGYAGAEELLRAHPDLTALIALNDAMAIGVLSLLRGRGIAVPQRISVAGVDDVAVAADLAPSLTTVRLPMTEMGEMALLMALKPPSARPRRRSTGHQLIVRDSTGPVTH